MNTMQRLGVLAFPLVLAASVGACDGDSHPTAVDEITGTYQLISLADQSLPVTVGEDEVDEVGTLGVVLSGGALTLSDDATYSLSLSLQTSLDGEVTEEDTLTLPGTFEVSGDSLTFTNPQGEFTGTISGPEITVAGTVQGVEGTLVFRK